MQIIVSGHGHFATGLQSNIKLLAGDLPGLSFVDFTGDMDEQQLAAKFTTLLEKDDQTLFFCDLIGGTPYKQAVLLTRQFPQIAIVAGCNVGSLLEICVAGDWQQESPTALGEKFVSVSQQATQMFHHRHVQTEPEDGDGI